MDIEDGLDKLLLGQYGEALNAFERAGVLPQTEKLCRIAQILTESTTYAAELARGNLSAVSPGPDNHPAAELKSLHTKLRRLARQLLMATTGYPAPPIDYMGDLSEGLNFLIAQAHLRKKQAEHDRDHDAETGLLNRRAFIRGVYDILRIRPNKVGVLFCCGLDNIKYINDTHGFDCGDLYIGKVVEVLNSYRNDVNLISRLGGNEFAVYAHGFDSEEDACASAREHIKTLLNTKIELPREVVKIRASCGMAVYPHDATTSDVLMNYAGHALFEVRNFNRGTIMRFSPEIYRAKANLLSRQERLDELIEGKLIRFAFQPIINLKSGEIDGYEALMRPEMAEFSSPLDVLALAEAQSKLHQLERVTFEVIFDWIYRNSHRLADKKIFFNTISVDYLDIAELRAIHPHYESISKRMVFEILENANMESTLLQKVNDLRRELSPLIAIDDFGCGHSNALRLITISPDILKIDRFFINNIQDAPESKTEFLSNILAYCRAKGILALAEGVETYEELESVTRMGFDYAQGFYLGRPEFELAELAPRIKAEIAALGRATGGNNP
ncbi:GGDEF domain-containing protein [Desulfovibrio sp. OttesenSCG-928-O18]|nr:GGDEF domain-containing protein [Desulfovibrio sp. OttesenSCG-928-O18]